MTGVLPKRGDWDTDMYAGGRPRQAWRAAAASRGGHLLPVHLSGSAALGQPVLTSAACRRVAPGDRPPALRCRCGWTPGAPVEAGAAEKAQGGPRPRKAAPGEASPPPDAGDQQTLREPRPPGSPPGPLHPTPAPRGADSMLGPHGEGVQSRSASSTPLASAPGAAGAVVCRCV